MSPELDVMIEYVVLITFSLTVCPHRDVYGLVWVAASATVFSSHDALHLYHSINLRMTTLSYTTMIHY